MAASHFEMAQQQNIQPVSLTELAYLRRLQKYGKRKSHQVEYRRQRLETSCEARGRIIQSARSVQQELTDSIQSGNRKRFASFYHTFQTLKQACDEWDAQSSTLECADGCLLEHRSMSFPDGLSPDSRSSLLNFLSRVAFDPAYLLDRLLSLSAPDFAALLKPCLQSFAGPSIFASPSRKLPDDLDHETFRRFLDFSRRDVLAFLLRLIPKNGSVAVGPRPNAWEIVCAGLLSHQKPGSDKFVVGVLNAHVEPPERVARNYLENWLLETLQNGHFLVDHYERNPSRTKISAYPGYGEDEKASEVFFSQAISRLLKILNDNHLTEVIPNDALNLGKAIVARLEPSSRQQQAAPYFLCTRWLFASYISSLIKTPENFGLLLSHHISPIARQRILGEVADRARHLAEDVAYSRSRPSSTNTELLADMENLVDLFRSRQPTVEQFYPQDGARNGPRRDVNDMSEYYVTTCTSEIMSLFHGLYPEHGSYLFHSIQSLGGSTLRSSASSISGLSLFRTTSPCEAGSPLNGQFAAISEAEPLRSFSPVEHIQTGNSFSTADAIGIREACGELGMISDYDLDTGNCDLFSEKWIRLSLRPGVQTVCVDGAGKADSETPEVVEIYEGTDSAQSLDKASLDIIHGSILVVLDDFTSLTSRHHGFTSNDDTRLHSSLMDHFERARASCYHQGDFAKAHSFYRASQRAAVQTPESVARIFHGMAQTLRRSIERANSTALDYEQRAATLNEIIDAQQGDLNAVTHILDRLREKMWYVSEIQPASHYEDLRRVVSALRIMASPARPAVEKKQPSLRHRSASRSLSQDLQLKAEAATLELLSAPIGRGGPNKLGDVQVEITLRWMQTHGAERICRSEERIHRFCSELSICLDHVIGHSVTENPILWSSELFRDQRSLSGPLNGRAKTPSTVDSALDQLRSLYTIGTSNPIPHWSRSSTPLRAGIHTTFATRSLSPKLNSSDYFGCRSPTLTHKSSGTLWSNFSGGPQSPSSATSLPSRTLSPIADSRPVSRQSRLRHIQNSFLEELKRNITSLLLSDFDHLFREGSETDSALRKPSLLKPLDGGNNFDQMDHNSDATNSDFDFDQVFRTLLKRLELQASPYAKLDILLELQSMLNAYHADSGHGEEVFRRHDSLEPTTSVFSQGKISLKVDVSTHSRTSSGHDSTIRGFRQLFHDPSLRPKTLFRDLQYIASLVPLSVLDSTPRGRAFWNATIAALDLKQEICQSMIETADQIIQYHTFNRGHSRITSAAQAKRDAAAFTPPYHTPQQTDPSIANSSMADAATLLQTTAREGIPAAQRELATLYLTHPELLGVCLAPFTRPRDVFKDVVASEKKADRDRYDPVAMALAQHWMELSAKGGDGPATRYLRAKDEIERIP